MAFIVQALAPIITKNDLQLAPGASYTVDLPQSDIEDIYDYYGFRGGLLIYSALPPSQQALNVTIQGFFEPLVGKPTPLTFNLVELAALGQVATVPDNVFPVFQEGSGFYALKWSPVSPYVFRRLIITISNKNQIPITVNYLLLIYEGYKIVTDEKLPEFLELIKSEPIITSPPPVSPPPIQAPPVYSPSRTRKEDILEAIIYNLEKLVNELKGRRL